MLGMGLRHGDSVGIMAGNCYQYIEVFLGGARIGCPVVVLNTTYTPAELERAVRTSCESSMRVCFWKYNNWHSISLQACLSCYQHRLSGPDRSYSDTSRNKIPQSSATRVASNYLTWIWRISHGRRSDSTLWHVYFEWSFRVYEQCYARVRWYKGCSRRCG